MLEVFILVDYIFRDLLKKNNVHKEIIIKTDIENGEQIIISNEEIHSQQFELTESICSENEIRFGCCESSYVKFRISNIFKSLIGKWITISVILNHEEDSIFQIGRYKVESDIPTADRSYRDVTAYDAMYDILNSDVSDWYNKTLPDNTTKTMKTFRNSFLEHFGLEADDVELINDGMILSRTIDPSEISGKDIICAICEINACFGHIGRNGNFQFIYLKQQIQGLYPADTLYPSNDLFPIAINTEKINKSHYINCQYEDFVTKEITKLQIRQEDNDVGTIVGDGDNCYVIEDNFLVYGISAEDTEDIANNIFEKIKKTMYRPFSAECIGDFCLEVGDAVRLCTKYEIVESYIFSRTLKGIQNLKDTYSSDGKEKLSNDVNSVQKSIVQLKGKVNILERTSEKTISNIKDLEENIESKIEQSANTISSTIKDLEENLESQIEQSAGTVLSTVAGSEKLWTLKDDNGNEIKIDIYGFGEPPNLNLEQFFAGIKYLDQTNGIVYKADYYNYSKPNSKPVWEVYKNLNTITADLETRIEQTVSKIELEVKDNESGTSAGIVIKVQSENGDIEELQGTIELSGLVKFIDLSTSGTTEINGDNITTGSIKSIVVETDKLYVIDKLIMKDGENGTKRTVIQLEEIDGQTYPNILIATGGINQNLIIKANTQINGYATFKNGIDIESGTIQFLKKGANRKIEATASNGLPIPIFVFDEDNKTTKVGAAADDNISYTTVLRGNVVKLASAGSVTTSDERLKNSFKSLEEFEDVYMDLEPCAFKFNNGTSGRYHFGAKAQNVRDSFLKNGYTTSDFGGFVQMEDSDKNEDYCGIDDPMGLIYGEFVMWNTYMIQKAHKKIEEQQKEIDDLKEKIDILLERGGF